MSESPRFSFHPLERRGVLLGLNAGQLATVGVGAFAALGAHAAVAGAPGALLAIVSIGTSVALAVCARHGQPLIAWAAVGAAWMSRRGGRTQLSAEPQSGTARPGAADPVPSTTRIGPAGRLHPGRGPLLAGIDVVEIDAGPVGRRHGAVRDRLSGSWSAVVPVGGLSFSLLDREQQLQALEGWRTVLASVARPGGPVIRLQLIRRSGPAGGAIGSDCGVGTVSTGPGGTDGWARPGGPGHPSQSTQPEAGPAGRARASYLELVQAVAPVAQRYDTWLVVVVSGDRHRRPGRPPDSLGREVRFLEGQLRQARLEPGPPLGAGQLHRLLGSGAMAVREGWSSVQVDGDWHATFWVADWPRHGVGPDFLLPLLIGKGRRTVSVAASPVATERALREVRSARTADMADAQLRSRAGFLSSARRDREAEGVVRREQELADGHVEYRFSAYVSVAAEDEPALALAVAELQQAAQAAHLELRRLYGRQAEALGWILPAGRGLR